MEGDLIEQMRCLYRKKARDEQRERGRRTQVEEEDELPTIRQIRMLSPRYRYGGGGSERQVERQVVDVKEYGKDDECVICMDERRRVVFIPCGHMVTCVRCADIIVGRAANDCPMCRRSVKTTVKVFR